MTRGGLAPLLGSPLPRVDASWGEAAAVAASKQQAQAARGAGQQRALTSAIFSTALPFRSNVGVYVMQSKTFTDQEVREEGRERGLKPRK